MTESTTEKFTRVLIGFPGSSMPIEVAHSLYCSTHDGNPVLVPAKGNWLTFNALWTTALNYFESGDITHFAMLHHDIAAGVGWLDVLMQEMAEKKADLVSVVVPLKDARGVCSSGIGDPDDPWEIYRRITARELTVGAWEVPGSGLVEFPETFDAADLGYPGMPLMHNNGLWLADLSAPAFHATDELGNLRAMFQFPSQVYRAADGKWHVRGESEDWYFSRQLHLLGAKTYLTRKLKVSHLGGGSYCNFEAWGTSAQDEDTAGKWRRAAVNSEELVTA
jgi:hypothetical protein